MWLRLWAGPFQKWLLLDPLNIISMIQIGTLEVRVASWLSFGCIAAKDHCLDWSQSDFVPRPGLLQDWLAGKHGGREAGEVSRDQGWKTLLVVIQGLIMGQVNQSTSLIFLHFFFFGWDDSFRIFWGQPEDGICCFYSMPVDHAVLPTAVSVPLSNSTCRLYKWNTPFWSVLSSLPWDIFEEQPGPEYSLPLEASDSKCLLQFWFMSFFSLPFG